MGTLYANFKRREQRMKKIQEGFSMKSELGLGNLYVTKDDLYRKKR
jgi:hypothetical protein